MRSIRKRVLACILILTMVLAWNNGYGITIVNASESADYEGYVISKEQYESFISTETIEPEGDSCSGSLSSIVVSLSNEAYTYISRKSASSTNSEEILIPANAHVIIDCQLNPGAISSINLGENAECILEGTYNSDLKYNGSTGSLLTIVSATINGVISGNNQGSLNLIKSGKIYGLNNIEDFIVNPHAELLVQPMNDGVYKPVSFNRITGAGTLNLIYNGYPKYENESSVEVAEVPQFLGDIDLSNDENGTRGYVNLRFITPESIDKGEYRQEVELPAGTQAINISEDLVVPLLTDHCILYGDYFRSPLEIDLNGSLSNKNQFKLVLYSVSDQYTFEQGVRSTFIFRTSYPNLLMKALSKLKAGYYNITVSTENVNFGDISIPENIQGLYINGNQHDGSTTHKTVSIDNITMASSTELILGYIRETSTNDIHVNIAGSEVNKKAKVRLDSSRIAGIISCQPGVDIWIASDNVVKGIEGATNLTLNGNLDVAEKLSVSNLFKIFSTYNLFLESGATVSLNNVQSTDRALSNRFLPDYGFMSQSLNMFYECKGDVYPNVTIAGSTSLGISTGLYWFDSTPTDGDDYKDGCSFIYYRDVKNGDQTERQRYVNINDKWNVLNNNNTVTPCEAGFDGSNLTVEMIQEGIHITAYNSYTASDDAIYEDGYNMNDALNHKAASDSCPIKQVLAADYTMLCNAYSTFKIEFSNVSWKFDLSKYHGDTKFISELDESSISIDTYAGSYSLKTPGFIRAINSKPFVAYKLDQKDFEDFEQGKDYKFSEDKLFKVGTLGQISDELSGIQYVVINQVLNNSSTEDITIPAGCHCILSTERDVTGKLGNVTVKNNATLGIQGNYTGNIQCIGNDNNTDTTEDDSQFVLRDFNLKGSITGNQKGKLTLINHITLSGITNFDICNLVNSDNLDVVPNENGKYERVSFKDLHGTADFHISYCGYPSNQEGDTEQILVPELTPNIMLGEKTVKTAANDTYTVWYEGDNRYISDSGVYYHISDDPDHAGCIVKGEPATDITSEDVHCKENNLSVTYYNSSDFANRVVQEVPTDGFYVNFGSLKNGFEMIYSNKVVCSDYPNYLIDCDGRMHSKNADFIHVKELTKENFAKVGTEAYDAMSNIPTFTAENAMAIADFLMSPYVVFTVNSDNQSFNDLEVPESKIGLAIQSGEKEAKHIAYKLDSIILSNDQTLVLDNLRTNNTKALNIIMAQEGTSGTVRFINSRVNQEVMGTDDITVEVKGNNAFKSLINCKELLVNGPQLTIEKILDGIGSIKIATNSNLIAKSTASIRLPKIICDSYLSQTGNKDVQHYYALNILAEQVETQLPNIMFSDMIEPTLSDQYVSIMPYSYENSIDGGNLYAEQNYNWGEFEKNQLSLNSNEAYIFKVNKEIMLKENPNDLLGKILLCYKGASLHFDAVNRECMKKEGNDLSFVGYTKNDVTKKIELSKKFGYCNADFKDLWNTFTIGVLANQNYSGREYVPEVTLSSSVNDYQLRKDVDYEVEYTNNIETGKATVKVKGLGLFRDYPIKFSEFHIGQKNITDNTIAVANIANQIYTGREITPALNITDSARGNAKLIAGKDYTVKYTNNISCGTATVTVSGAGNYIGTLGKKTFKITQKSISAATITVASQTYSGSYIKPMPKITLTINGTVVTLRYGTDFTVTHSKNMNVGTAYVTIYAKGNYTGTKGTTFKIIQKSITPAINKVSSQYYSGKALKPGLTVKYGTKTLKYNIDYTLSYKNNKNIGNATITITGKGNYKFSKKVTFTIALKKGATYTVGKFMYKVTDVKGKVILVKSTNTKATSIMVGSTVKIGGKTCNIIAIGDKAMSNHQKLTKVTIGSKVTSIGDNAFSSCVRLKSIVISSSKVTKVGKNAFYGIYKKVVIKVPRAKLELYYKLLAKKGLKRTVKITTRI